MLFVEDRQILEALVAANEVADDLIARKRIGLFCKLDMEKTYDHVCWDFVDHMLNKWVLAQNGEAG